MTSETRLGLLSAFGAYLLWGGLPLYFRALEHIGPVEMLVHRILWGLPTAIIFVIVARTAFGRHPAACRLPRNFSGADRNELAGLYLGGFS